jgi:diguanylate cyclase (GGDEF)-like protein
MSIPRARYIFLALVCLAGLPAILPAAVPVDLSGEWSMREGDDTAWAAPELDDSAWRRISLPAADFMPGSHSGWFWLRRTVTLDSADTAGRSLVIGEVMNYDQAWVNGEPVGSTGTAPPYFRSGWGQLRAYPLPDGALRPGPNTIALRVYFDSELWVNGPIMLEDTPAAGRLKMASDFLRIDFLEMLSAILLVIAGLFGYYYVKRPAEREYLFFALSILMLAISIVLPYVELRFPYGALDANQNYAVSQITLLLFPPLLALFIRQHLHSRVGWQTILAFLAVPVLGSVAILAVQEERWLIIAIRTPLLATIPVFIGIIVWNLAMAWKRGDRRAAGLLASFLPVVILAGHDVLTFGLKLFEDKISTYVYAMPLLVILFTFRFVGLAVNAQAHNEKLQHLVEESQTDPLTGLYTRRSFEKLLGLAFGHAARQGESLVVAMIDVDDLKFVNDRHGHAAGDELIRRIAAQVSAVCRKSDLLSRHGGDEFLGLYFSADPAAIADNLAKAQLDLAGNPIRAGDSVIPPRFSWGLSLYPDEARDLAGLIALADKRMYAMKAAHKGTTAGR